MNFIRNGWYACGFSDQIKSKPVQEMILGSKVAVFRAESGAIVALEDRCPHRFAPLSMGEVIGETIECPYHGLRFGANGACTFNPQGEGKVPAAAKVRSYPVAERHGVVWIWPGKSELADESKILELGDLLGHGKQPVSTDSFIVNAHVGILLDNIMDLSHAPHLHRSTFADIDDMKTLRVELEQVGDTIWSKNYVSNARTSPLFKPFRPPAEEFTDTIAHMQWHAPSLATLVVGVTACGKSQDEGIKQFFVHMLTPMTEHRTKYWWMATRNFAMDNEMVTKKIHEKIAYGFIHEDEPAVTACDENMATTDLMSLNPVLLPGDAPAIRVRRMVDRLARDEALQMAV